MLIMHLHICEALAVKETGEATPSSGIFSWTTLEVQKIWEEAYKTVPDV